MKTLLTLETMLALPILAPLEEPVRSPADEALWQLSKESYQDGLRPEHLETAGALLAAGASLSRSGAIRQCAHHGALQSTGGLLALLPPGLAVMQAVNARDVWGNTPLMLAAAAAAKMDKNPSSLLCAALMMVTHRLRR